MQSLRLSQIDIHENNDTVQQVWKEYLRHVESSFLGEDIPGGDYEALSEQHRLGGVHSRILDNHRSMLARQQQVLMSVS